MARGKLLFLLLFAGCGGDALTALEGDVPPLLEKSALQSLEARDQAYVAGHALALYLYGKTLPRYVEGTAYSYFPGRSSPYARVPYHYDAVVNSSVELEGLVIDPADQDTIRQELEDDTCFITESGERRCPDQNPENPDDGGDPRDRGDEPEIDSDCESFLDPAAMEARFLAAKPLANDVLAQTFDAETLEFIRPSFRRGVEDALALEDQHEETDYSEPEILKDEVRDAGLCEHSPLVLDLAGDGVFASTPEEGVLFDLREIGRPIRTAWPSNDDALLAIDLDRNGEITHGGELFGASKQEKGGRFGDGFESLARFDKKGEGGNNDGVIDALDRRFAELRVWRDADRNGSSEAEELVALPAAGVHSISLRSTPNVAWDKAGNRLGLLGTFTRTDGSIGATIDVWFRVQSAPAPALSAAR